ncbi:hypothetical protein M3J09_004989 [Ascochyta lentis]
MYAHASLVGPRTMDAIKVSAMITQSLCIMRMASMTLVTNPPTHRHRSTGRSSNPYNQDVDAGWTNSLKLYQLMAAF